MFARIIGYIPYNNGKYRVFAESGLTNNNYINEYLMDSKNKLTTIDPSKCGTFKGYVMIATYVTRGPSLNIGIEIDVNQEIIKDEIRRDIRYDYSNLPTILPDYQKTYNTEQNLFTVKAKLINLLTHFDERKDTNLIIKAIIAEKPDKAVLINLGPAIKNLVDQNSYSEFIDRLKNMPASQHFYMKLRVEYIPELDYYRSIQLRWSNKNEFDTIFEKRAGF